MNPTSSGSKGMRPVLLAVLAAGIAAFLLAGGYRFISFRHLVANKDALIAWADAHTLLAPAAWVGAYLVLGFFGLPGSTVLNVSAGVLFDFQEGLLLVLFASTVASSLAFLSFRYLFRDFFEARLRRRFPAAIEDLEREGLYFVFALRLLPVIPYSATNFLLAISPVRFWPSLAVSFLALLPRYLIYVYAGTHLGDIQSPSDLWSPSLIGALTLLGIVPWVTHWAAGRLRRGRTSTGGKS
ncbi:MAG: TVP38/TMEM64 family protein [Thermoanaerobaculia bacterium]